MEGQRRGGLGEALIALKQYPQAEQQLTHSIDICTRLSPPLAGTHWGNLALVFLRQHQLKKALEALSIGESLFIGQSTRFAIFMCKKAQVLDRADQHQEARQALRQAQQIAVHLESSPLSKLWLLINETQNKLSMN